MGRDGRLPNQRMEAICHVFRIQGVVEISIEIWWSLYITFKVQPQIGLVLRVNCIEFNFGCGSQGSP